MSERGEYFSVNDHVNYQHEGKVSWFALKEETCER